MLTLTRPLVIFDLESTGVDPTRDRIIEFAAVVLHPDGHDHTFTSRFNPGIPIPKEATEIHGITDADVAGAPLFSQYADKIWRGFQGRDIGGYNVRSLDLPLVDEELRRCGLKLDLTGVRVLDAFTIFQKKEGRSLADAVRKYCGRSHEDAHGAQADAAATLDVLKGQLAAYEDLAAMTLDDLSAFSRRNEVDYVDLAGKLYRKDGDVYYGFGKCEGMRIQDDTGFARWMLSRNFSGSTLDAVRRELDRIDRRGATAPMADAFRKADGQ